MSGFPPRGRSVSGIPEPTSTRSPWTCRWPAPDEIPTLDAEDYPAIATRTPADEVDRDDRWGARACDLALTLLLIAGWEIVDLLPGCDRHGWFDECYGPTELWLATRRPHSERVAPALRAAFARRLSPTTVPHVKMGVRTPF